MPTEENRSLPVVPLVGIALIVIGAIGPWVTVDGIAEINESGLESDGVITLPLALIAGALLLAFRNRMGRGAKIGIGICAALCLIISIIDVQDVAGTSVLGIEPSVGWGLWLTLAGSIVLVAGIVLTAIRR
jgi:hypothetical protein